MPDACSETARVLRDTFCWPVGTAFIDRCTPAGYMETAAVVRSWTEASVVDDDDGDAGARFPGRTVAPSVLLVPISTTSKDASALADTAARSVIIAVADGAQVGWGSLQDTVLIDFFVSSAGVERQVSGFLRAMDQYEAGALALVLVNRRAGLGVNPVYTSPPCYAGEFSGQEQPGCRSGDKSVPGEDQMDLP
jgi:hypothetical protein